KADWSAGAARRELLERLARLEEERRGDRAAAIARWREILAEDPEDGAAPDALERLHGAVGEHAELADIVRRRVPLAPTPAAVRPRRSRPTPRCSWPSTVMPRRWPGWRRRSRTAASRSAPPRSSSRATRRAATTPSSPPCWRASPRRATSRARGSGTSAASP